MDFFDLFEQYLIAIYLVGVKLVNYLTFIIVLTLLTLLCT